MARVAPGTHDWGTQLNQDLNHIEAKAIDAQETAEGFRAELELDLAQARVEAAEAAASAEEVMLAVTRAGILNEPALTPFLEKLAKAATQVVKIGIVAGDSILDGTLASAYDKTAPMLLQKSLRELTGTTGGVGYIPATPSTQGAIVPNPPNTRNGSAQMWAHGLGGRAMYLSNAAHHVTYSPLPCRRVRVNYGKTTTAGGSLRVEIDGVDQGVTLSSVATGSPAANSGGHVWTSPQLAPGNHVVKIVPGNAPFVGILEGVEFIDTDEVSGVRVYNGAHSGGSTTSYLTTNMGLHWQSVAALGLDLAIVELGVNDLDSLTPAQFLTNMDQLFGKVPAGVPILVIGNYLRGDKAGIPGEVIDWGTMQAGLRARALGRVAYVDLARWWPELKADGSTSGGLMFDTPPIHPNTAGMERFAKILTAALRPPAAAIASSGGTSGGGGNTFTVRYNTTTSTWPARPDGGAAITVNWVGGTDATPPPNQLSGVDLWVRDSAPGGGGTGPDPGPEPTTVPGWLKTPQNTGLAAVGTTVGMLTHHTTPWAPYNGAGSTPNLSGNHYRKIFTANDQRIGIAANATFTECLFIGDARSLPWITFAGTNITFNDCDFEHASIDGPGQRIVLWMTTDEAGMGAKVYMNNCRITGGTVAIYHAGVGGELNDVYAYAQMPEGGNLQHRDGFTSRGSYANNVLRINRNRYVCDQAATTGAFFTQNTWGDTDVVGLQVYESSFEGGGYCITLEDAKQLTMKDCRTRSYGLGAVYGALTFDGTNTYALWQDNHVWANTPANNYKGAALAQPTG